MKRVITVWILIVVILTGCMLAQADNEYDYYIYLPLVLGSGMATPASGTLHILPNHSWYVDGVNYLHVIGEVQNNTPNDLSWVMIITKFLSPYDIQVALDFSYPWLSDLPASDKTCFDVSLPEPGGWASYEFEPLDYWTDGNSPPDMTVLDDSGSYNQGDYEIVGTVRKDSNLQVEYVNIVGTLYNASGNAIGCGYILVNTTYLQLGQQTAFEIRFSDRNYVDVVSYRLQIGNQWPTYATSTPTPTATTKSTPLANTPTSTPTPTVVLTETPTFTSSP